MASLHLTKVYIVTMFVSLSKWAAIMLKVPSISFDVPHHQILPGQLIMIGKVTYQPV